MNNKQASLDIEKNTALAYELLSGTTFANLVDMAMVTLPVIDSDGVSAYYVTMLPAIAYAVGEGNAELNAEDMLDPTQVDWIGIADLLAETAREVSEEAGE
jgi:hypothetical protein